MEKVTIDEVEGRMGPADVKRPVSDALGAEHVAVNYYELEPGESFAFGYHSHEDQEELFYVLEGTATFETGAAGSGADAASGETATDSEEVTVEAGEAIRFAPGEWQQGYNRGDGRVRALAVGAPRDGGEVTIRRDCADCGARTEQRIELTDERDALVTVCLDCESETGRFT